MNATQASTPLLNVGSVRLESDMSAVHQAPLEDIVSLPLVSIIVVNYNYGRYLRVAVESAIGQTYSNIECIIVDNASTDDSGAVICALEQQHPSLKVVRRVDNGWQTRASLDGLAQSHGAYVVFLDADDILLPKAIEMHVFAHLSLRAHVGFTSGDMLQMVDGQVVLASGRNFSSFVDAGGTRPATRVRPYTHINDTWPKDDVIRDLGDRLHLVPPQQTEWIWSPTSGNCFRRDALLLFVDDPALPDLKTNTDLYLARGINSLCGSALIDRPVFAYRLHGNNAFSKRAQLDGVLSFDPAASGNNNTLAQLMLIDHFICRADRFVAETWIRWTFIERLIALDVPDDNSKLPNYARRSRVAHRLLEHFEALVPLMGRVFTLRMLLRTGVPFQIVVRKMIGLNPRKTRI